MKMEDEFLTPCYICGKVWQRKDHKKWVFFSGILACKDHPGVSEWYKGAQRISEERRAIVFNSGAEEALNNELKRTDRKIKRTY